MKDRYHQGIANMRAFILFASVAAARSALTKGPFLRQINSTQWVFGNDIWNLTQGPTYAINLQYQGSDAVKNAPGHYAGYGAGQTIPLTFQPIVADVKQTARITSCTLLPVSFRTVKTTLILASRPRRATYIGSYAPSLLARTNTSSTKHSRTSLYSVLCGALTLRGSRTATLRPKTHRFRTSPCTPTRPRCRMRLSNSQMAREYHM
jgi:hypothetical protein